MPLPQQELPGPRPNAQDLAYDTIKDWIINGPLEAGELLRDTEIAGMLGVSRTPVREALIRLSQEGLVTIAAGRRTKVAELDFSRAADLYAIGSALDSFAAETAAGQITDAQLDRIESILQAMAATDDRERLEQLDQDFHRVYYAVTGNAVLVEYLDRIDMETKRIERVAFGNPVIRTAAHGEHARILDALRTGDPEAARSAAAANWRNSWQRIHDAIEPRLGASTLRARTGAAG
ncbi:MAG TPA: GntR family transcriptional regulator [Nakamurella sp.]|nr:GntR family transcriptional regulator [Nakamurella sp.]